MCRSLESGRANAEYAMNSPPGERVTPVVRCQISNGLIVRTAPSDVETQASDCGRSDAGEPACELAQRIALPSGDHAIGRASAIFGSRAPKVRGLAPGSRPIALSEAPTPRSCQAYAT